MKKNLSIHHLIQATIFHNSLECCQKTKGTERLSRNSQHCSVFLQLVFLPRCICPKKGGRDASWSDPWFPHPAYLRHFLQQSSWLLISTLLSNLWRWRPAAILMLAVIPVLLHYHFLSFLSPPLNPADQGRRPPTKSPGLLPRFCWLKGSFFCCLCRQVLAHRGMLGLCNSVRVWF